MNKTELQSERGKEYKKLIKMLEGEKHCDVFKMFKRKMAMAGVSVWRFYQLWLTSSRFLAMFERSVYLAVKDSVAFPVRLPPCYGACIFSKTTEINTFIKHGSITLIKSEKMKRLLVTFSIRQRLHKKNNIMVYKKKTKKKQQHNCTTVFNTDQNKKCF